MASKRDDILRAAQAAFVREGYATASMDRVAELAGASKRTVYNYFPSKEQLFHEVLAQGMAEAFALEQVSYDARRDLQAQLEQFADAKLAFVQNAEWLGMMKVIAGMLISDPALVRELVERTQDRQDALASWLREAHADGRLRVEDPKLAADAFWAMTGGAFFWPAVFGILPPQPAVEALRTELVTMFLARYRV